MAARPHRPTADLLAARELGHDFMRRSAKYEPPQKMIDELCRWIGDMDDELWERGINPSLLPQ